MEVAVLCEYSGIVRDAFIKQGHTAVSFDILETESPGPHFRVDVQSFSYKYWSQFDLIIAHPPCTDLSVSGARWFEEKRKNGQQQTSIDFFMWIAEIPAERLCIENPIGIMSTLYRKPDQIIQPWMFGHTETKATCLWLKGLPKLTETNNVKSEMLKLPQKEQSRIHYASPGADRGKIRSKTYQGLADAMAFQWNL